MSECSPARLDVGRGEIGEEEAMRWIWLVIGIIAALVGIVWTLQGLNILHGSVMSGQPAFVVVGPIVAVVGLVLVAIGARGRKPTS